MAVCILCTKRGRADESWFLLVENHSQDRLRVLRWKTDWAAKTEAHQVCCTDHVLELVVHWMTTGSLDYPFARFGSELDRNLRRDGTISVAGQAVPDTAASEDALGELAIDRGSIQRVLRENPEALHAILSALLDALEARRRPTESDRESCSNMHHLIVHRA